jgi:hypothetical protein
VVPEIADILSHRLKYRTPQAKPPTTPKQVTECGPRSTSPVMMPSLLDMVKNNLKSQEHLPPDLVRTLERDGDTMVHEYYATKANKVIEHNRNNRDQLKEKKTLLQQSDMSWARDLIDEKLRKAEALVQARVRQQNTVTENGQQEPVAGQMHAGTSHQHTLLPQHATPQSPHAGPQCSAERHSGLLERTVPMSDTTDRVKMESRDPRCLRRATVETVTDSDSETSSWDGKTEYIRTDSDESAPGLDGVALAGEEPWSPMDPSAAWRDEWAINDHGIYYSQD